MHQHTGKTNSRNDTAPSSVHADASSARETAASPNRPPAVTAANVNRLQQAIGNRAVSQLLTAQRAAAGAAGAAASRPVAQRAQAQRKENHTGMPDDLKSGIEELSGYSMDDVKVHYNSSKPAQLEALAYAQGNEIHVGPGQEQHLPHEAWHVVQQRQGRVQPTMEIGGAAVNDDAALEQEADLKGEEAAQLKAAPAAGGEEGTAHVGAPAKSTVQRRIEPYDTQFNDEAVIATYKDRVEAIVADVNQRVINARADALQWQTFNGSPVAHLSQWHSSASNYVRNPEAAPNLIHARFGYAIETLACNGLGNQQGLQVHLQMAHGHTRPDIVISHGTQELAWIDITSEQSEGHIKGKDGSGWKTKPFIFEVLYDPLDLKEILEGTGDDFYNEYGEFLSSEHQIELDEKEKKATEFRNKFIALQDGNDWTTGSHEGRSKQIATKNFFFGESYENEESEAYRNKMQMTKGALKYLRLNDGPFGFNVGSTGQDSTAIKQIIDIQTSEDISTKQGQLAGGKNMELAAHMNNYTDFPAANQYYEYAFLYPADREIAKLGMLLKHALNDYNALDQYRDQLELDFNMNDGRVIELNQRAGALREEFPQEADFTQLQNWRNQIRELHRYTNLLREVTQAQQRFIAYAQARYPNFFLRPPMVGNILEELDRAPQNNQIVGIADNWMNANPIPQPVVMPQVMPFGGNAQNGNVQQGNDGDTAMVEETT